MDQADQYFRDIAREQYREMRGRPGVLGYWYRYTLADERLHQNRTRNATNDLEKGKKG
jgi:hypothetical protein